MSQTIGANRAPRSTVVAVGHDHGHAGSGAWDGRGRLPRPAGRRARDHRRRAGHRGGRRPARRQPRAARGRRPTWPPTRSASGWRCSRCGWPAGRRPRAGPSAGSGPRCSPPAATRLLLLGAGRGCRGRGDPPAGRPAADRDRGGAGRRDLSGSPPTSSRSACWPAAGASAQRPRRVPRGARRRCSAPSRCWSPRASSRSPGRKRADPIASLVIAALIVPRASGCSGTPREVLLEGTPRGVDLAEVRAAHAGPSRASSTCTTCTPGRSPAACRCCPHT